MDALEKEAKSAIHLVKLGLMLLQVDTEELRRRIALGELLLAHPKDIVQEVEQPGQAGFQVVNTPDTVSLRHAIEDCKFFLFVAEEWAAHLKRQQNEKQT